MLLIITWYLFHNYFWPRPWPQPPEIGLGLVALALALASRFWPHLTRLVLIGLALLYLSLNVIPKMLLNHQ